MASGLWHDSRLGKVWRAASPQHRPLAVVRTPADWRRGLKDRMSPLEGCAFRGAPVSEQGWAWPTAALRMPCQRPH